MDFALLGLTFSLAAVNWVAVGNKWKRLEWFAKPAVMLALLAWLWHISGFRNGTVWLAFALVFSLAGDVFLMLPKERFTFGVASFLLAHISYIIAFNFPFTPPGIAFFGMGAVLGILAWRVLAHISYGLKAKGYPFLRIPLFIYGTVLCLMALSALLTLFRPDWHLAHAVLVSIGGVLFLSSDSVLAWNKFVKSVRYGRVIIMATYHLGQVALIIGAALHFMSV